MTEELKKHPVIVIALEYYNPSDVLLLLLHLMQLK